MKKILAFSIVVLTIGLSSCFYFGSCFDGVGSVITESRDLSGFTSVNNTGSFEVYITQGDSFSVSVSAQENLLPIIETTVSGSTLIIKTVDNACYRTTLPVTVEVTMPEVEQLSLSGSGTISTEYISGEQVEISLSGSGTIYVDTIISPELLLVHAASGKIYSEYIDSPDAALYLSGSGLIEIDQLLGWDFAVNHSASGSVKLSEVGADMVNLNLSGSGRIELAGEASEGHYVNSASGRIDALDFMVEDCTATTAGSGSILLYATGTLEANVLSSGSILYIGDPIISYYRVGTGSLSKY